MNVIAEHLGVKVLETPKGSIGFTTLGPIAAAGALRMLEGRTGLRVLDICCGTGMIGLALARAGAASRVVLSDLNPANVVAAHHMIEANSLGDVAVANLADCLDGLCPGPYDLIVGNPPHVPSPPAEGSGPWESFIANYDVDWDFHRRFYSDCHNHLAQGGAAWLIENRRWYDPVLFRALVARNLCLEWVGEVIEPGDPNYVWVRVRRP